MNAAREPKASEHRKSCLEDSTERSESNPGRSLGIIHISGDGCLEDSTTRYARTPLARSLRSKSITDNPDATDLFFTDFFVWIMVLFGFLCACMAL